MNAKNKSIIGKQNNQYGLFGVVLVLAAIALVFVVEQIIQPGYWIKSVIKASAFLGTIFIYSLFTKTKLCETLGLYKLKKAKPLLLCMLLFFAGIAIMFFAFRDQLDLTNIKHNLMEKENLTKENCLFVFSYIIFCNSFLEESFFRGFIFRRFENKMVGAIFSAVLFSVYHIGIFITWFNPFIFSLSLVGLAAVGLFLQWLAGKYNTILASYITHACANIAINIIGILLIFEVIR